MTTHTIIVILLIGIVAGILSGLVGIGGGIVIVPALIYFFGYSQQQAQGTSIGLLLLPAGILAALNYYKQGYIDIKVVLIMAVTFTIGGWLGSKLAVSLPQATLKKAFAVFLGIIAIKMIFFEK